jgi:hypothetical protein
LGVIDEKKEDKKRLSRITDSNESTFTKLILSIDVSNSNGKIALAIVKSCKTKEFEDGNTVKRNVSHSKVKMRKLLSCAINTKMLVI